MPIPTDLVLDLQRRLGYAPPERRKDFSEYSSR